MFSPVMALVLVGGLFFLLLIGVPVVYALGLSSLAVLLMMGGVPLTLIPQKLVTGNESFTLLAVPFFLLAGLLMESGGIGRRIFQFMRCLVGHIPGGLGHVNVLGSMVFAGMSGTATADAVGLGSIEIPAMEEAGFDTPFAAAVTAASATIGPIIPPSVPMVIYGVLGEVSIARLFVGGIIPGVLMGLFMMVFVYIMAVRRHYPVGRRATLRQAASGFKQSWIALLTPIILMGGIMTGVFTPTEAGVAAVVYALVVSVLIYREYKLTDLPRLLTKVGKETAIILIITAAAGIFGWLLTVMKVPLLAASAMGGLIHRPLMLLLVLNLIYLIVGCFINTIPAIVLTVPVFLPIARMAGIDPVHFGLIVVLNLCTGMLTPPVGSVLFVITRVGKVPILTLIRELTPFYVSLLITLLLVTVFPGLTLWLPRLLFH